MNFQITCVQVRNGLNLIKRNCRINNNCSNHNYLVVQRIKVSLTWRLKLLMLSKMHWFLETIVKSMCYHLRVSSIHKKVIILWNLKNEKIFLGSKISHSMLCSSKWWTNNHCRFNWWISLSQNIPYSYHLHKDNLWQCSWNLKKVEWVCRSNKHHCIHGYILMKQQLIRQ